ncbi:hypothetical protein QVD17_06355 [Tagetes erecta]|uniref:F-box domain-containing protein n=1 Tax=Tagetes erecta TaxID=13708 RepID=A0AAD8LFG6_TARER|nr:hypothetical protein QVD17_06355 [Tagetes erecta]
MDRITQLPESIVHHILSYLYPKELLRMSLLSNTWFNLTASFPILDFNIDNFTNASRQSFFKYIEYATSRFCLHNVSAHRLKIITTLQEPAELDILNTCVESLLKKGVTELEISIARNFNNLFGTVQKYRLPDVLLSLSMLKSLSIDRCHLPSSFMLDALKLKSLIVLELKFVRIDDEVIKYITTSCPLLQVLEFKSCRGFKTFCVIGHQNLQKVIMAWNKELERIHIEAPNLSYLWVAESDERRTTHILNLASCKKLTTVTYSGDVLPNSNSNSGFLSNFPFVETLMLDTKCNNLKLSSHSLRTLVFLSDYSLEDIEFRTPNLATIDSSIYHFTMHPSVVNDSTHLKASMHCYPFNYIDATWFQKLRQFLYKKNGLQVFNLNIDTAHCQKFGELEKLKAIELPPYELEHVQLELDPHGESLANKAFVDAVLWCCRPRSLILKSSSPLTDFEEQSDIVKFTYEKLLEQEDRGRTKIQFVPPFSNCKAQKVFSRFCHLNVTAQRFDLLTTIEESAELDIVNSCVELVLKEGVREFVIYIENSLQPPLPKYYRLPNALFSLSMLRYLTIYGCELPSSLMTDVVQFKSLTYLTLQNVPIDDELVIKHITTSSPKLQIFQVQNLGLKRFCVFGHQNLQTVWISYNTPLERIDIDAPNLTTLSVIHTDGRFAPQMNLVSCKKLTSVFYIGGSLTNSNGCTNFLSSFPFIEDLILCMYNKFNSILSSHSLRTLVLQSNCDLDEVEFNAPNLVSFIYACGFSTRWRKDFTESEELKLIKLPPYELEHVELQLDTREEPSAHVSFLDAVIWCCRPRSLTLRSSFPFIDFEDVVKFTYEKLVEQEDEGDTKIQIVLPSSSEAQNRLKDFKSLPMAISREEYTISFIKDEVVQDRGSTIMEQSKV